MPIGGAKKLNFDIFADTTLELPTVHYRKNNRLTELTVKPDDTDAYLERIGLSRDIVQGLSKGLDLRVSSINLDTSKFLLVEWYFFADQSLENCL